MTEYIFTPKLTGPATEEELRLLIRQFGHDFYDDITSLFALGMLNDKIKCEKEPTLSDREIRVLDLAEIEIAHIINITQVVRGLAQGYSGHWFKPKSLIGVLIRYRERKISLKEGQKINVDAGQDFTVNRGKESVYTKPPL